MARYSLSRRYKKIRRSIELFINKSVIKSLYTKDIIRNEHLAAGDFTYGEPAVLVFPHGQTSDVTIGKYCSIAPDVKIFTGGNHRLNWVSMYPFNQFAKEFPNAAGIKGQPWSKGNVVIGNDVWIGQGAVIMSGVNIGDGAVIGAYCVVASDVEAYQIVVGNPMQKVRKRFDDDTIASLLTIKWWEWTDEKVKAEAALLCSPDMAEFIAKHYKTAL